MQKTNLLVTQKNDESTITKILSKYQEKTLYTRKI